MDYATGTLANLTTVLNGAIAELGAPVTPATGTLASATSQLIALLEWRGGTIPHATGTLANAVKIYNLFVDVQTGHTHWPPEAGTYPAWPPIEIGASWLSCSDLRALLRILQPLGFTQAAPTTAENTTFFANAICRHGDGVIGRMLVSPDGLRRYPFAVCIHSAHRDLLTLWPPYYCGMGSGDE